MAATGAGGSVRGGRTGLVATATVAAGFFSAAMAGLVSAAAGFGVTASAGGAGAGWVFATGGGATPPSPEVSMRKGLSGSPARPGPLPYSS